MKNLLLYNCTLSIIRISPEILFLGKITPKTTLCHFQILHPQVYQRWHKCRWHITDDIFRYLGSKFKNTWVHQLLIQKFLTFFGHCGITGINISQFCLPKSVTISQLISQECNGQTPLDYVSSKAMAAVVCGNWKIFTSLKLSHILQNAAGPFYTILPPRDVDNTVLVEKFLKIPFCNSQIWGLTLIWENAVLRTWTLQIMKIWLKIFTHFPDKIW